MEKRVKLFFELGIDELEHSINEFLDKTSGKLQDIKYQYMTPIADSELWRATALLIYTPGESYVEKKIQGTKENIEGPGRISEKITPLWEQGRTTCKI